jgi:hypothetical protein
MTIHLPNDVECDILAQVQSGQFATVGAAITEAWQAFQRHRQTHQSTASSASPDRLLGSASDHPELMNQKLRHRPACAAREAPRASPAPAR